MSQRFWFLSAIRDTIRQRGLWAGLRVAYILVRGRVRETVGKHHHLLANIGMAALTVGAVWLGVAKIASSKITSGDEAWVASLLIATSVTGIFLGLGHFLLDRSKRSLVLFRALNGTLFAVLVGGVAYLGHGRWTDLYRTSPESATLWGLLTVAALLGFYETLTWFLRCALFLDSAPGDLTELSAMTELGRRRVAIHEAGHAVCYGLCERIPEDAYAAISPDLITFEGGAVGFPRPTEIGELTQPVIEWMLVCTLAGSAAEELVFGDRSAAGAYDMDQAHRLSVSYLMAGFGDVLVPMEAKTEAEVAATRAAVARLRSQMEERTARFLAANRDTIDRIATQLEKTEFLDCQDLAAVLVDVRCPEGVGMMAWPPSIPTIGRG